MADNTIQPLAERLACDLVLADPTDADTLSCLLPLLKKLHDECRSRAMNEQAGQMVKAKDIIQKMIKKRGADADQQMDRLNEIASELSRSVCMSASLDTGETADAQATAEPALETANDPDCRTQAQGNQFKQLEEQLDRFGILIGQLCPEEIWDIGAMIANLDELIAVSKKIEPPTFYQIALACQEYVETIPFENNFNTKPIEEGLVLLRSILSHLRRGEAFTFDYSDVIELLDLQFKEEQQKRAINEKDMKTENEARLSPDPPGDPKGPVPISDDDMEIMVDFVSEARENLETIEVSLVDLEQDPSNVEIINDIFRPFHTIKGVSGFLSLTKINRLAHATENLLDSARNGDFIINQAATDAILESVDMLKILVERVGKSTETGVLLPDNDVNVSSMRDTLQSLQTSLTRGEKEPLGEILVRKKAVEREGLNEALDIQKKRPDKKIGEILVEENRVSSKDITSALMEQGHAKRTMDTQVKVSTQKLDDLVDFAGELVIAQSMLRQKTAHDPSLAQSVTQLGQIVSNMQTIAMSMRMIPIKSTFMKMIRLVRDLSRKSGKQVDLKMSGEETEIDRNVVDALYEPMVHMIRNSVDHGIEPPEERKAKGKAAQGTIHLRAYHKGGHIIIEIEDDGKGLDRDRILEKALSTGLVTGNEQMTDSQVFDLIMAPGFSTASQITDVSGRGVGMDVVKSGIEKFRGQLNIDSQKDNGTKFTISLPLTLAIIDGMLVQVSNEKYVIPTISIQKAFKPGPDEYFTVKGQGEMVKDRGDLVPLIRLDDLYNDGKGRKEVTDCLVVVVESKEEKRGLLIDELLGKDEYVIKSLGSNLEDVQGIAGGAILADGRVGLILDIFGIFSLTAGG
ncbi:chemotaxis protein CheA [uncultured Desulfobacter sp.]|uniref:chemotaxis protein CheA n=1 Tax=uncultured Desulfobacter sp. TaxID=240139 RepID=UPI0029C854C7|nr:chemotaxis protein CheA [uncultured Desulfobacter sp.]